MVWRQNLMPLCVHDITAEPEPASHVNRRAVNQDQAPPPRQKWFTDLPQGEALAVVKALSN